MRKSLHSQWYTDQQHLILAREPRNLQSCIEKIDAGTSERFKIKRTSIRVEEAIRRAYPLESNRSRWNLTENLSLLAVSYDANTKEKVSTQEARIVAKITTNELLIMNKNKDKIHD